MSTQTAEPMTTEALLTLFQRITALPSDSLKKLNGYVEELIEEQEDAEDIAYIRSLKPEDYENAIPLEEVIAKYEKQHGPLD